MSTDGKKPAEVWEENNSEFSYDPPEMEPEAWSQEDYTELYDRVIGRRVEWSCQKCSKPFSSLEKARRHVERHHGDDLMRKAEAKVEDE